MSQLLAGLAALPVVVMRKPTRLVPHLLLTGGFLLLAALVAAAMRRGWRRRARRQADWATAEAPPEPVGSPLVVGPLAGMHLGTTTAGNWLDRVAAHSLGGRAGGRLLVRADGVALERVGLPTWWIPATDLAGVRVDSAHAGKVAGPGRLLVLTWRLGPTLVDSGFRATDPGRHAQVIAAVEGLLPPDPPSQGGPERVGAPGDMLSGPTPDPGLSVPQPPVPQPPAGPAGTPGSPAAGLPPPPPPSPEEFAKPASDPPAPLPPPPSPDGTSLNVHRAVPALDPLTAPLEELLSVTTTAPPTVRPGPAVAPRASRDDRGALYVLEDGTIFSGQAYGAVGESYGEAVFATGMTGYQETLTDPSFHRQILAMTAPHIGNTGMNDTDPESTRIWVSGFVVRDPARRVSNWRSLRSLDEALADQGVVGISGIDTRALTRHLRERGPMRAGVSSVESDPAALLERVRRQPGMNGSDLVREVTTAAPYVVAAAGPTRFTVAALDLGIKASTPRYLSALGVEVHVLPATSTAEQVRATGADGVFFSNGPGDPAACGYVVDTLRDLLGRVPVFGICMGNQMLGQALGLSTYKLPYGHRGVNQPVLDVETGSVAVTSQNHGYAVAAPLQGTFATPYGPAKVSHIGLNDQVVEGLRCLEVPAFSVQYHPEAAPGPHDAVEVFAAFCRLMDPTFVADGALAGAGATRRDG